MEAPKHQLHLLEVVTFQFLQTMLIGLVEQKLKGAAATMRMAPIQPSFWEIMPNMCF